MKFMENRPSNIFNVGLYYDKVVYFESSLLQKEAKKFENDIKKIFSNRKLNIRDINNNRNRVVQLQNKYPYYDLTFNNYTKDKTISLIMDAHKGFISRDPLQYSKDLYKKNIFKITNNPEIKNQLKTLKETREQMMKSMKTQGYKTITIEAKLDSPMLVGIGNPSIDEIGFYWNRNYSVPTVPGSSIKGAFRNYWKTEKLDGSIEKIIFGSDDNNNSSRGEVVFMEAIPVDKFDLMQEFQTPHFGDYYSSNKVPNDVHNPVPLNFISVKEGSTYRFDFLTKNPDENIAKEIKKHFKIILEYIGIGSKTSMGYGRFRNIENKQ
jgi:CRISPR-associated protein Cmr6